MKLTRRELARQSALAAAALGLALPLLSGCRADEALNSPNLSADPNFKVFLQISSNPATSTTPPSGAGTTYQDDMGAFVDKWQAGKVPNLAAGLTQLDTQINQALAIAG